MLSDIRSSKNVQESSEEKTAYNKNKVAPKLPWLTLPHGPNCKQLSFYSLSDGEMHRFNLPPLLQGGVFCGSSKGWLIIGQETFSIKHMIRNLYNKFFNTISMRLGWHGYLDLSYEISECEMFLFNPISGVIHQLPPLSTLPTFYQINIMEGYSISSYIKRIELSSPNITSECIVGGLFFQGWLLAFCKPGDKQWSVYGNHFLFDPVSDLLFYNGGFIGVTEMGGFIEAPLHTIGLKDCQTILKLMPIFLVDNDHDEHVQVFDDYYIDKKNLAYSYLVESSNTAELLLVRESIDTFNKINNPGDIVDYGFAYRKRRAYKVFKVDPITGYIRELKDIGDQVIFVTMSGSLCLSKSDFDEDGIEGNCIFFAYNDDEYFYLSTKFQPLLNRELGIYYLDKGKIERPFPSATLPLHSKTSWFIPTL